MHRQKWIIGGWICFLLLLVGCQSSVGKSETGRLQVYTGVYPLQEFTQRIGGEYVDVQNVVPPGTEPHEFELSAKQMVALAKADLVIYNGAGLESWVEKAKHAVGSSNLSWVDTSKGIRLLTGEKESDQKKKDPHLWLDPQLAKKQAQQIYQALSQKDPSRQSVYRFNYQRLAQDLDQLDREYQEMVRKAKRKEFFTSHAAFAYLAHRYGLKQIAISGLSPMEEPSPQDMQKLVQTVKQHQIQYLFFETLANPKVAEAIRRETNVQALPLNPLEGLTEEEIERHANYFSVMRENKKNLAKALGSQS